MRRDADLMIAQRKREVTNLHQVRIPRDALDSLNVTVGDVLHYVFDNERIIVTKYGPQEVN